MVEVRPEFSHGLDHHAAIAVLNSANEAQDEARILVEVWEKDQPTAFGFARDLWALLAVIDEGDQDALPGLITYLVVPDFPVQYPDDHAPDLDRHQFTVTARVAFEEVNVP